jgi:hypothetical protein
MKFVNPSISKYLLQNDTSFKVAALEKMKGER